MRYCVKGFSLGRRGFKAGLKGFRVQLTFSGLKRAAFSDSHCQ